MILLFNFNHIKLRFNKSLNHPVKKLLRSHRLSSKYYQITDLAPLPYLFKERDNRHCPYYSSMEIGVCPYYLKSLALRYFRWSYYKFNHHRTLSVRWLFLQVLAMVCYYFPLLLEEFDRGTGCNGFTVFYLGFLE